MEINFNNTLLQIPDSIKTVKDLLNYKEIPSGGTAVAVNDNLIVACSWDSYEINDRDKITVISAAFGG